MAHDDAGSFPAGKDRRPSFPAPFPAGPRTPAAIAYGIVAMLSRSEKTLVLTGSSTVAAGTALAGNLWLFGVLVVTLAAVVGGVVVLRRSP
ncbi:hypothetical protein [Arthrobacter sp. TMS2-4]